MQDGPAQPHLEDKARDVASLVISRAAAVAQAVMRGPPAETAACAATVGPRDAVR